MAFNSILRRASASVLPLVIRSVGSQRTFHSAISTFLCVEKLSLSHQVCWQVFLPFFRFSTATVAKPSADENLIRVLDSEIGCAEKPADVEELPAGFPFEIQDNPGERTVLLKRNFQDENIKVEVDAPSIPEDAEDDDHDQDKNTEDSDNPPSIPLVVSISKGNGLCLEFGITAYPDEITIDTLSLRNSEHSEDELACEGPDFFDLDENLQKAFHKYLEIRGIKPSTTNFLFEYMRNKDDKEYLLWLKNLRSFMER
ncbi:hypothetical protein P3X46_008874 [Hevea brasiliensis]|uniref:Mitochondrial glycoprotein n=1 Tax=Hevea brasiliensis TaxID=3981 RepID=A0ABQ9MM10_HEVBR|nr:uncharacterized protein At2g39795, mitochondrial [Hevea brasiliensis]KAJ9180660.1 hypothetical protein P3X46_008874 [Hevea brasiliensis]